MKKLLLVLLSIGVVFLIWGMIAGIDIQRGILNESFFDQLLEEVPLAEAASRELPQIIVSDLPAELPPVVKQELPHAVASVFTPAWFQKTLRQVSRDVLDALAGEGRDIVISIEDEKMQVYEALLGRLGELSDEELMRGGLPRFMIAFIPHNQLLQGIPNALSLQQLLDQSDMHMDIEEFFAHHRRARRNFIISMMVLIPLCAAGYVLLAGLNGAMRWAGWTFIVSGSLYLVGLLVLNTVLPNIPIVSASMPPAVQELLVPAAGVMLGVFIYSPMLVVALGALLVIASLLLPKQLYRS